MTWSINDLPRMEMYSECWSFNVGAFDFIMFEVKSERPSMWTLKSPPSRTSKERYDGESEEGEHSADESEIYGGDS